MARILLVEDDDAARYATAKILATVGHEVLQAHDYQDALPILEDRSPLHLLLMDVMLPGVHGFALARMARMKHHDIRCIYVTAHDVATNEAIGPVLRKPLVEDQLLAEVRRALAASPVP